MLDANTKAQRRAYSAKHSAAVRAVREFGWTTKQVANLFTTDDNNELVYVPDHDNSHTLVFPLEKGRLGHYIGVSFSKVKGHPEMIRIRATNYRAEDEPNGLYNITDARRFYAELLTAGLRRTK